MQKITSGIGLTFVTSMLGLVVHGCTAGDPQAATTRAATAATQPTTHPTFALFGPPPTKTGVQIWSENCMRCHYARTTQTYSDAQWEIIVHHMRLRANLTGAEARGVVSFLQAGS